MLCRLRARLSTSARGDVHAAREAMPLRAMPHAPALVQINNAHLIHDHSTGRSSTRLHAPPGGGNSMGTSFAWDDAPAQVSTVHACRPCPAVCSGDGACQLACCCSSCRAACTPARRLAERLSAILAHTCTCPHALIRCRALTPAQPTKQVDKVDPNAMSAPAEPVRAPRVRKGDFVDNRIGAGVAPQATNENTAVNAAPVAAKGFGDTGAPAIKVHHAPGGKSSGNILNWS